MKQIGRLIFPLLILALIACSAGKTSNSAGVARIRATALAAQQIAAQPTPEAPTPAPIEAAPASVAQPQPIQAAASANTAWPAPQADDQRLDFIAALGIILLTFATGCVVGSIVTAYTLGRREVKRG